MKKAIILVSFLAMALTGFSQAKIAHVNSEELMKAHPDVVALQAALELKQNEIMGTLSYLESRYKELSAELQSDTVPAYKKPILEEEISDVYAKYQEKQASAQEELYQYQAEQLKPIADKIKVAIAEVAKEKGYDYVIDSAQGTVVYANEAFDLMPAVKAKLGIL